MRIPFHNPNAGKLKTNSCVTVWKILIIQPYTPALLDADCPLPENHDSF